MTEFMLAPRNDKTPVRESLRDMLDANELVAYRVRGNGTTRLIKLLPVSCTEREVAEWIYDLVEDGTTVQAISRQIHSSTATVRRYLEALEITEEVEAGEWDSEWAALNDFAAPAEEPGELVLLGEEELGCQADNADQLARFRPSPAEKAAGADAGVVFS